MGIQQAKWIWIHNHPQMNEYAVFEERFSWQTGKALFQIAAETDYVLYVNGTLCSFGQFAGYPFEKYYDTLDITAFLQPGENVLHVTVRYEGVNSATHIDDGAGVIYALEVADVPTVCSSEQTLGGYDYRYIQHQSRFITVQLGLTAGMRCGEYQADTPCVAVEKTRNLKPRPVEKLISLPPVTAEPLGDGVYDLGREMAGQLFLQVQSAESCQIKVAYAEHMESGTVRHEIATRDFSLDFELTPGTHCFTQYFVRVAGRYLKVYAPEGVQVLAVGLVPVVYPVKERSIALTGLDRKIYDTCVRTMHLCMHTHYEDTPWREQALYVMDSRNQMLTGYYAFEGSAFQRANLAFIAKGTRPDGLLELTYPAVGTPAIPFFSTMYPVQVYEYVQHTGDRSILEETMPTMLGIMNAIRARIGEDGLIPELEKPYWNFYEWSEGGDSGFVEAEKTIPHLILNCAYVYACGYFEKLCEMAGVSFDGKTAIVRAAVQRSFFCPETGLFSLRPGQALSSQLGNAFALLIGLGDGRTVEALKYDKTLVPATLSMLAFVYDALLVSDRTNSTYILEDIRSNYGYMLEKGATSFWETIEGAPAFYDAGSLCHGWSAIPVYYYHVFKEEGLL